jgi:hypothetical protein
METATPLKIRPLKVADLRTLTAIIKRLVAESKQTFLSSIIVPGAGSGDSDDDGNAGYVSLFTDILVKASDVYAEDVTAWFASLLGVTAEEYMALPFDTDLLVVQQITEDSQFSGFFTKACAMFKLKEKYGHLWSRLKEMSGIGGESPAES